MDRRNALKLFGAVPGAASSLDGDPSVRGELQYIGDVDRLVLKPGDRIVLSLDGELSDEMVIQLRDRLATVLGGEHEVIVLSGGMKLGVLGA